MIFYFSGTGNTKWIAQQIAIATGDELKSIPDELRQQPLDYQLAAGERLGFCFPVHGWQPPHIVREFICTSKFNMLNSNFIYVFSFRFQSLRKIMVIR